MDSKKQRMSDWSADDLERAAKYMRELDASKNAKPAIELARREQDVEIESHKAKQRDAERARQQQVNEYERIKHEESRKTLQAKLESDKVRSRFFCGGASSSFIHAPAPPPPTHAPRTLQALQDYKLSGDRENMRHSDALARKRDDDRRAGDLEAERVRAAVRRQAEEEIQAEKRRSDEHRARLERDNMKARALAEAEGRIKEQRENEDLFLRQLSARAKEERATRLESITSVFKHLGESLSSFIVDTPRVTATVTALTALAVGVYASREGARVAAALVKKRLLTPPLVRETSRAQGLLGRLRGGISSGGGGEGRSLDDVVLTGGLAARIGEVSAFTRAAVGHGAPFRNMLFYGPPGTGKTMVASRIARGSGLDYAIMSGGDVGPLGRDAVTELHKLLDWAEASPRGLLLFVDEADAFLASRSRTAMSEDQRNALNALLFRTGSPNKKLMLVFATNRPGDLDAAVLDRCDEELLFDLPDAPARRKLVMQYFEKYITRGAGGGAAPIAVAPEVDASYLEALGDRLVGFSGRGVSKLLLALQSAVYGKREAPTVTRALVEEVLRRKLAEPGGPGGFQDYVAARKQAVTEPELR